MPRWRESDVFTPLERDVLEYAEAMTNTPPIVTDDLSASLLERLGPAALVELTVFIPTPRPRLERGTYCSVSRTEICNCRAVE